MVSKIEHEGLTCHVMSNGEIELSGIAPFDMIVRLDYETGIIGEQWCEWRLLHGGTNIDDWSWDHAKDHAESYGHYEDEEDDDDFDIANCSASVYWYNPDLSESHINGGSPNGEICQMLKQMEVITDTGYTPEIFELLHLPDEKALQEFLKEYR